MISVLISIGSNCGDREEAVEKAVEWLSGILDDFVHSPVYETPGVGNSKAAYMNCVAEGVFHGELTSLEKSCKDYELSFGRDSECRQKGLVPIDIDIVKVGETILKPWDLEQSFFKKGLSLLKSPSH